MRSLAVLYLFNSMIITAVHNEFIGDFFCVERHDDEQPGNLSAATATCGIARTKDLVNWERLPDLKSRSQQTPMRSSKKGLASLS